MMIFFKNFFNIHKNKILLVVIIILIIAIFSVFAGSVFKNRDDVGSKLSTSVDDSPSEYDDGSLSGDSTILVVCNGENLGEAMFMVLLDFHIYANNIVITPLESDVSDGTRTYSENYAYGGINELARAVKSVRNCNIDRYVVIDKDGINDLTDLLGSVNIYVSQEYTYVASDTDGTVMVGYNELEAEMLYAYLKLCSEKNDGGAKLAQTLCELVNSYIDSIKTEDAQELFGELCNCVNTNISVADYYICSADIAYLLDNNAKCTVSTVGE